MFHYKKENNVLCQDFLMLQMSISVSHCYIVTVPKQKQD